MVKQLGMDDKNTIVSAIARAEACTDCEIIIAVAPICDAYYAYAIIYGLLIGSAIDLGLSATSWSWSLLSVLMIQLASVALFIELPLLRHAIIPLVPTQVKHARAAQRAAAEYVSVFRSLSPDMPLVMFFISLAERYVHVFANGHVIATLPEAKLEEIAEQLASAIRVKRFDEACAETIDSVSDLLAVSHPFAGKQHRFSNELIELTL